MANVLSTDKKIAVIGALAKGSSIRSIERITGVHWDTIMRLGVRIGKGCTALMDAEMRDLDCHRLGMDEIWILLERKIATFALVTIHSLETSGRSVLSTQLRNSFPLLGLVMIVTQRLQLHSCLMSRIG